MNATYGERRVPHDRDGLACASGGCLCEDDGWEGEGRLSAQFTFTNTTPSDRSHHGNNGSAS